MRDGRIVAERYRSGEDWKWNLSLGVVDFGPETLHDIRSVSKSVTSLLFVLPDLATVIAIAGGSYDSVDQTSTASAVLEAILA